MKEHEELKKLRYLIRVHIPKFREMSDGEIDKFCENAYGGTKISALIDCLYNH